MAYAHSPNPSTLYIRVDIYKCALIDGVIHELLHHHFRRKIGIDRLDDDLEELMIRAVEEDLVCCIEQDERLVKTWRNLIRQMLKR